MKQEMPREAVAQNLKDADVTTRRSNGSLRFWKKGKRGTPFPFFQSTAGFYWTAATPSRRRSTVWITWFTGWNNTKFRRKFICCNLILTTPLTCCSEAGC